VSRAQDAGLLARTPSSADARVVHLRLSAQGEKIFARAFRNLASEREALREAIAHLDD
jgi:DNA-binding MarR family transcriptional regulator